MFLIEGATNDSEHDNKGDGDEHDGRQVIDEAELFAPGWYRCFVESDDAGELTESDSAPITTMRTFHP